MWPNPQETADLVTLNDEILNGKLHFLSSVTPQSIKKLRFSDVFSGCGGTSRGMG